MTQHLTEDVLGFCASCYRMRWLAWTTHMDDRGTPHGVCRTCARHDGAGTDARPDPQGRNAP